MMDGVKMNITKLDKSKFLTNHVLYILRSNDLGGLYYIGAHSCLGSSYNCSESKCHYKGSSSIVADLVALHPSARWVMSALAYASSREELKTLEEIHLSLHVGQIRCLNIKTSGQLMPKHTLAGKQRMRDATRAKGHRLKSLTGKTVFVKNEHLRAALIAGYSFVRVNIKIKNYQLGVTAFMGRSPLDQILVHLLDQGWQIGEDRRLHKISAKEFWSLVGYKIEQHQYHKLIPI
jgi:hypothetical protein